jgi:hypothetical protein
MSTDERMLATGPTMVPEDAVIISEMVALLVKKVLL